MSIVDTLFWAVMIGASAIGAGGLLWLYTHRRTP